MKERIDEIIRKTKGVKTGSKMIFDGGFIKVFEEEYTLPDNRVIKKQRVQKNNGKDAVVIITRTIDDKYIMVFQNRVDNIVSCEFPSGYVEKDEDIVLAALRELEEETGYIGEFLNYRSQILENNDKNIQLKIESNIFFDPWKSSDNSLECFVKINGDDISNKKKQKLDKDELIKVYEVELDKLIDFLKEKINKDGYGCSSQLYNFALGIHFNFLIDI